MSPGCGRQEGGTPGEWAGSNGAGTRVVALGGRWGPQRLADAFPSYNIPIGQLKVLRTGAEFHVTPTQITVTTSTFCFWVS